MICDSTNIFYPGRAGSESDVRQSLLKIMSLKSKELLLHLSLQMSLEWKVFFIVQKKLAEMYLWLDVQ